MFTNSNLFHRLTNALNMSASQYIQERNKGNIQLNHLKQDISYPLLLFTYMQSNQIPNQNILLAAIEYKNWLKKYQVLIHNQQMQQYEAQAYSQFIAQMKLHIIKYYLSCNKTIANQLEPALCHLINRQFPSKWPDLMTNLITQGLEDQQKIIRVLKIIKATSSKYVWEMRSDPLYQQIIIVCNQVHDFLFSLKQLINNPKILSLLLKIFYNLNFQDLHPNFEDNLNNWMNFLIQVMKNPNNQYKMFKCKGQSLKCILLYANKYRQDVTLLIQSFSQQIWNLATQTNQQQKYDKIVQNALKYFRSLILWTQKKQFFKNNIRQLISSLIIPNIKLTNRVIYMFKQDPQLFIQHFFQRYDISSRRYSAIQLLKVLCKHYQVTDFFQQTLFSLIQNRNYQNQICILNMLIDGISVSFRIQDGTSEITLPQKLVTMGFQLVRRVLINCYQNQNDKLVQQSNRPQYIVFYIRYIFFFRLYIQKEQLLLILTICNKLLNTKIVGLRNAVLMTINAIINVRHGDYKLYCNMVNLFTSSDQQITCIFQGLYKSIIYQNDLSKYTSKLVKSLIIILKQNSYKYVKQFCQIYKILLCFAQKGYQFQKITIVFEGISNLVYNIFNYDVTKMQLIQSELIPYFNKLFEKCSDLLNFILQIYALVVQGTANIKTNYVNIFYSIINIINWCQQNSSLFLAYIVYIKSYLKKKPEILINQKRKFVDIFIRLSQLGYDKAYFSLSRSVFIFYQIMQIVTYDILVNQQWIPLIIHYGILMYEKMGNEQIYISKKKQVRPSINKNLVVFICQLLVLYPTQNIIIQVSLDYKIQKIGLQKIIKIFQKEGNIIRMIQDRNQRKIVIIGITNLLFNLHSFLNPEIWASFLVMIIDNFLNKRNYRLRFFISQNINKENNNNSFKKLQILQQVIIVYQQHNIKQNQQQYFKQRFNQVYPYINNQKNISILLTTQKQQLLTKILNK